MELLPWNCTGEGFHHRSTTSGHLWPHATSSEQLHRFTGVFWGHRIVRMRVHPDRYGWDSPAHFNRTPLSLASLTNPWTPPYISTTWCPKNLMLSSSYGFLSLLTDCCEQNSGNIILLRLVSYMHTLNPCPDSSLEPSPSLISDFCVFTITCDRCPLTLLVLLMWVAQDSRVVGARRQILFISWVQPTLTIGIALCRS
jgi:hypothetical protein